MRWLQELRNPSLKCGRVGHVDAVYRESGLRPGGIHAVATELHRYTRECDRCGIIHETCDEEVGSIQSLSLPGSRMDQLKEDNWLPGHDGKRRAEWPAE